MSEDIVYLLQVIRNELQAQDTGVVGRLELRDQVLAVYDGQMLLEGQIRDDPGQHPSVTHCHVIARIGRTSLSDPLDACVVGIGADRRKGLADAARNWVSNVGSVLFSLLHAKPVMNASHFCGTEPWGVPGAHGFVGPISGRGKMPSELTQVLNAGLFEYAAAMAPPGIVHLGKVVLEAKGEQGWKRVVEVDGHMATHEEAGWKPGVTAQPPATASQFAVFHYGGQEDVAGERQRLDEAIRRFVEAFAAAKHVDTATRLVCEKGFSPEMVDRVASFAPLAFCYAILARSGATFSGDFRRVREDGVSGPLKLMCEPAYARSLALFPDLVSAGLTDGVKGLSTCSSTFAAINSAANAGSRLQDIVTLPVLIPEMGVSDAAVERALKELQSSASLQGRPESTRPWWRFW